MERNLKKIARLTGFAVLLISIYFSYDGFDQSVSGQNTGYTTLATIIGLTLAIVVSVMQFIFGTSYANLNWTLRFAGVAAYIYSIYTNYLGIKHVLGADDFMAMASALFMDIYPEPAIAWSMGEALVGDLVGNLGKIILGDSTPPKPVQNQPKHIDWKNRSSQDRKHGVSTHKYVPKHKPNFGAEVQQVREMTDEEDAPPWMGEFRPVNYK